MAMSYVTRVSDGVTTQYDLPFGYLSRQHVFCFVNDELRGFRWISGSRIELLFPAPLDADIKIRRLTERASRVTNFVDGQTLLAGDLNAGDLQSFYIMQELIDQLTDGVALGDVSILNPDGGWLTAQWVADQIDGAAPPEALAALAAAIADEAIARGDAVAAEAAARTAEVLALTDADAAAYDRLDVIESDLNTPTTGIKAKIVEYADTLVDLEANKAEATTVAALGVSLSTQGDSIDAIELAATALDARVVTVEENKAEASALSALTVRVDDAEADIVSEQTLRSDGDSALALDITALDVRIDGAEADIVSLDEAIVSEAGARATSIDALSVQAAGIAADLAATWDDAAYFWDWSSGTLDGWQHTASTVSYPATGGITLTQSGGSLDMYLRSPVIAYPGNYYTKVVVDVECVVPGTLGVIDGRLYWQTSGHSESGSYSDSPRSDMPRLAGERKLMVYDLDEALYGAADYEANTITRIRVDLPQATGAVYTVHSVRIVAPGNKGALSRISTVEADVLSAQSAVADLEANKAEATDLSALTASVASQVRSVTSGGIIQNGRFAQEFAGTTTPPGWSDWANGDATYTLRGDVYGATLPGAAGQQGGVQQVRNVSGGAKYMMTAQCEVLSGNLTGAGLYLVWSTGETQTLTFATTPNTSGQTGAGLLGINRWEREVKAPAGATYVTFYAMSHWSGHASVAAANSICWTEADLKVVTSATDTQRPNLMPPQYQLFGLAEDVPLVITGGTKNTTSVTNPYLLTTAQKLLCDGVYTYMQVRFTSAMGVTNMTLPPGRYAFKIAASAQAGWASYYVRLRNASNTTVSEVIIAANGDNPHVLEGVFNLTASVVSAYYLEVTMLASGASSGLQMWPYRFQIEAIPDGATGPGEWSTPSATNTSLLQNSAAIVTEAAARASADGANATLISQLRTETNSRTSLGSNPYFDAPSASPGVPPGWTDWVNGTTKVTQITKATAPVAGFAARMVTDGGGELVGVSQYIALGGVWTNRKVAVRAVVRRQAGASTGAGVYLAFYDSGYATLLGDGRINFATDPNTSGVVSSAHTGRTTYEKVIACPTGTVNIVMYAMASWSGAFPGSVAKTIDWYECSITEVGAGVAGVTDLREALTTGSSSLARLMLQVNTATNVATIEAAAFEGDGVWNGSAITLQATLIKLLASSINFGANTVYEDTKGTIYTSSGGQRIRILGPFGTSNDLVMWYGPTSVGLNSETKTNGKFALATDGKIYTSGADFDTLISTLSVTPSVGTVYGSALPGATATTGSVRFTITGGTAPYQWDFSGVYAASVARGSGTPTSYVTFQRVITAGLNDTAFVICRVTDAAGKVAQAAVAVNFTDAS